MHEPERAEFTNLCMVYDQRGNILVQDRKKKEWPGICFPGGHVEPRESFVESVIREVYEETGLTIEDPRLCGIKQFQTRAGVRYVVLLYKTNRFSGELRSSAEGEVFWVPRNELSRYPLADDFLEMVQVMESEELSEFFYSYQDYDGQWEMKLL